MLPNPTVYNDLQAMLDSFERQRILLERIQWGCWVTALALLISTTRC